MDLISIFFFVCQVIRQLSVDDKSSRSSNITEDIAKEVESDYASQFIEEDSHTIKEDIETEFHSNQKSRADENRRSKSKSYSENFSNGDSFSSELTSSNTIVRSERNSTR